MARAYRSQSLGRRVDSQVVSHGEAASVAAAGRRRAVGGYVETHVVDAVTIDEIEEIRTVSMGKCRTKMLVLSSRDEHTSITVS